MDLIMNQIYLLLAVILILLFLNRFYSTFCALVVFLISLFVAASYYELSYGLVIFVSTLLILLILLLAKPGEKRIR